MIPQPPKKVLGEPGMSLEGRIVHAVQATNPFGREVLEIRVLTSDGRTIPYTCNQNLWRLIHQAAGHLDEPHVRITRAADGIATGNGRPPMQFTVELLPAPAPSPAAIPAPAAPDRNTTGRAPAW